jgi:hypothetical protein
VQRLAVTGHRRQVVAAVQENLRKLASTIRSEVEEDRRVAGFQARCVLDDHWLKELVGHARAVARPYSLDRISDGHTLTPGDRTECLVNAIPPVIAIHRPVAPHDRCEPSFGKLRKVVHGRMRRDVATIGERMYPRLLGSELEERLDVIEVRVNATLRYEAKQVNAFPARERRLQDGVLEERSALDGVVHALEVLVQPSPRPDRQMANLRVTHLAWRQTHRGARGIKRRVGIVRPEFVEHRCVRELDCVARAWRREPPAVKDDDRYEWEAA